MFYCLRDESGALIAVGEKQVAPEWQPIKEESEEVRQFLQRKVGSTQALEESDIQFIRVLDDVIELLIEKQVIQFTELPEPAQKKLLKRRWYRQQLRGEDDTTHLIDPQEGLL